MRPTSTRATECISEAITLLVSASANFHETSANSVNRSPIEAGNNQMLFPSIGACNRNNFLRVIRHACCDANVFWVTERETEDMVSQRDRDRMNDSSRYYSCRVGVLATSTLTKAQQKATDSQLNLTGLFVHAGVMELMPK